MTYIWCCSIILNENSKTALVAGAVEYIDCKAITRQQVS